MIDGHHKIYRAAEGMYSHMTLPSQLDTMGIWLLFFGALFLFIYGAPFDLPGQPRRIRRRKHVFFSYIGMLALLIGTMYQAGATVYTGLGL